MIYTMILRSKMINQLSQQLKMITQSTSQHKQLIQLLNLKQNKLDAQITQRLLLKLNKAQQMMLNNLKTFLQIVL